MVAVYETLDRPLTPIVTEMERHGIRVDAHRLRRLSAEFTQRMAGLEAEAYKLAGRSFNLGSPKQLGEVLFDELSLGGAGRKTKTGAYATGADVLEELALAGHALPRVILDWRQLQKLTRTYTDTLAAGDVFHAGFAVGLTEGWPMERTIAFASAAAAIKCTRFGGRLGAPTRAEVEAFLRG